MDAEENENQENIAENTPEATPEDIEQEVEIYAENETKAEDASINGRFLLKERYEIDFSSHLAWLDNNSARAYSVIDRIDASKKLFALICSNETAPRLSILSFLKSADNSHLMKLVDYGVVDYPLEKSQNMALIYVMPQGGKVFVNGVSIIDNLAPELFKSTVLGLLGVIDTLKGHGITHRAIRTDNLYFKDLNKTEIILGDCAASFPAYHQPPAFEPIESLYATLSARGDGTER